MPDYNVFVATILLLALARIVALTGHAGNIVRSLPDRSAAACAYRDELALRSLLEVAGYVGDVQSAFRRLTT